MRFAKKGIVFLLTFALLLGIHPVSYARNYSAYDRMLIEVLWFFDEEDGFPPEVLEQYPYIDASNEEISEFVDYCVSCYRGFSLDMINNWYYYPVVPSEYSSNAFDFRNEIANRLPQLHWSSFEYGSTIIRNQRCYRIIMPSDWYLECETKFDRLTRIEKIYFLGNFYTYMKKNGGFYILFEVTPGSPGVSYPNYNWDIDYDGEFNAKDLKYLKKYMLGWYKWINLHAADQNGDGLVSAKDLLLLKHAIVNG